MFTNKQGFTLIELLTVVLIIGILSAIAVPQYTKSSRRAEMTEGLMQGKAIYDSAVRYMGVHSDKPTSFVGLDISFVNNENVSGNKFYDGNFTYELPANQNGNYIKAISNKKVQGSSYELRFFLPLETDNGVFAPVLCCPDTNWMCKNTAVSIVKENFPNTIASDISSCMEIK